MPVHAVMISNVDIQNSDYAASALIKVIHKTIISTYML